MWCKLVQDNQWEYRTTYAEKRDGKLVKIDKTEYKVKWPNGTTETLKIFYKEDTRWYNDMGHEYSSTSKLPYIKVDHNGASFEREFYGLDCRVWIE